VAKEQEGGDAAAGQALAGRDRPAFRLAEKHFVNGRPMLPPYPEGMELALFGMGASGASSGSSGSSPACG
jgi:hypothetical protein